MRTIHKIDLQGVFSVEFTDPEKSKAFFIDGQWKDSFYDFSSLGSLSGHIVFNFYHTPRAYKAAKGDFIKNIEGFSAFILNPAGNYVSSDNDYGKIIVKCVHELHSVQQ